MVARGKEGMKKALQHGSIISWRKGRGQREGRGT